MKYHLIRSFVRQHLVRLMAIISLGIVSNLAGIVLLLSVGKYLEIVFTSGNAKSRALTWLGIHVSDKLSSFLIFFFAVIFIKFFCFWAGKYFTTITGLQLLAEARKLYFRYLLYETGGKETPKQLVWFSGELKALQYYFEKGIIGFIKDLFFFSTCLYLLIRFSIIPALMLLVLVIVLFMISKYSQKPIKKSTIDQRKKSSGLLSFISVRLHRLNEIRQTNTENKVYTELVSRQQQMLYSQYKTRVYKAFISSLVPFLLFSMLGLFMWLVAQKDAATIPTADATGFILLLLNLFAPVRRILKVESVLLPGRLSLDKLELAYRKLSDIFTGDANVAAISQHPAVQKIV
ncbi:MAG: hypothetical protein K2Q24_07200 [Chitinophagaceae bacterium]|nr:hypothetical protein [Chitinophagaceae bacterium]